MKKPIHPKIIKWIKPKTNMNIKIIETQNSPIIWDCFKAGYTQLLSTIPNIILCQPIANIDFDTVNLSLMFTMYNTTGLQESTRIAKNEEYSKIYQLKTKITESILIEYFNEFKEEYLNKETID